MARSRGFTLVELMVTIAVAAILLALATPSFADFLQRYRLRGAADDVASLVANARAEALMRNRDVSVVFTGTGATWCVGAVSNPDAATPGTAVYEDGVASTAPTCTCSSDTTNACKVGDRMLVSRAGDHKGVTMTAVPGTITFTRLTGAVSGLTSSTASLQSPNTKYALNVAVTPLGRGRLCVPPSKPAMSGFSTC